MAKRSNNNVKMGKYKHFKGDDKKYDAFALAFDNTGKEYVIYQALYGKKSFWIRNKEEFFDSVENNGGFVKRFTLVTEEKEDKQLSRFIEIIKSQDIIMTNEENGELYKVYKISNNKVYICKLNTGAYLSNIELAYRMGYSMFSVNGEILLRSLTQKLPDSSHLKISAPDIIDTESFIKTQFNPCSIDLHISDKMFIKTKLLRSVDPTSLKNVNAGTHYWKDLKIRNDCIKLKPGQSILTNIYEKIKIPDDCAGKIEIKSTYSRLSLSITEGDFCNPGYEGHFPLVIRNDGNNIVIIHPKEMMAQLILVKVSDSIISNYSQNATHRNDRGFDEGTPYSFWFERSLKKFRKENGAEHFYRYYSAIEETINGENTDDINGVKERFKNTFLSFIAKKIKNIEMPLNADKLEKYGLSYAKREKIIKGAFKTKWITIVFGIISFLLSIYLQILPETKKIEIFNAVESVNLLFALGVIIGVSLIIITAILFIKQPKSFCTFEKMDLGKIAKEVMDEINKEKN